MLIDIHVGTPSQNTMAWAVQGAVDMQYMIVIHLCVG